MKEKICKNCGKEYNSTGKYFCSVKCMGLYRMGKKRFTLGLINHIKKYGAWNKGLTKEDPRIAKIVFSEGTKSTQFKPQKHCYRGGKSARSWRRRAIWTLEKKYGIDWKDMHLPDNPVIHHIDGVPMNNKFNNLCVTTRSDHALIHYDDRAKRFTNMV